MKCICGYEYKTKIIKKIKLITVKGDKPFIYLGPTSDLQYGQYACPKCHTVKVSGGS